MSVNDNSIIIENSKVSLPIPVVNGCYLHSRFNPIKEAEEFAENAMNKVGDKNTVIVLGLGFGYHINELVKHLAQKNTEYKVLVIEPNTALTAKFSEIFNFDDPNVSVVSFDDVEDFFFDKNVIEFFQSKPALITHTSSYNLNKVFFTKFLSYKAPKEVGLYAKQMPTTELYDYFLGQTGSLTDVIEKKSTSIKIENKNDFLVQIIGELR